MMLRLGLRLRTWDCRRGVDVRCLGSKHRRFWCGWKLANVGAWLCRFEFRGRLQTVILWTDDLAVGQNRNIFLIVRRALGRCLRDDRRHVFCGLGRWLR